LHHGSWHQASSCPTNVNSATTLQHNMVLMQHNNTPTQPTHGVTVHWSCGCISARSPLHVMVSRHIMLIAPTCSQQCTVSCCRVAVPTSAHDEFTCVVVLQCHCQPDALRPLDECVDNMLVFTCHGNQPSVSLALPALGPWVFFSWSALLPDRWVKLASHGRTTQHT